MDDDPFQMATMPAMLKARFQIEIVDTANNGQIAIDMFEQSLIQPRDCGCHEAYRIIFMDS